MRIVTLTFGTEGDTRPMLAAGRGLVDAGHDVVVLAERSGEALAAALRVPFIALAGDMGAELRPVVRRSVAYSGDRRRAAADDAHARVPLAVRVVATAACMGQSRKSPIGARDDVARFPTRGQRRASRCRARAAATTRMGRLPDPLRAIADARTAPARLAPAIKITGDWALPAAAYEADSALAAFLAAGEAPVYVGFGSMIGFDRERLLANVLDALAGRRALLSAGWSEFASAALTPNVHRIRHVAHARLFPRVAVIVHHGGAGTTHAAARPGVASVVVPFAADQFFWADRLHALGIAPQRLAYRDVTAAALRERIDAASDARMRERARDVGRAMAHETGIANAIAGIEALSSRR